MVEWLECNKSWLLIVGVFLYIVGVTWWYAPDIERVGTGSTTISKHR